MTCESQVHILPSKVWSGSAGAGGREGLFFGRTIMSWDYSQNDSRIFSVGDGPAGNLRGWCVRLLVQGAVDLVGV